MSIAPPGMGVEEAFGIKRETTFGTAVAPDVWFRAVSNSMKKSDPPLPLGGPTGGMVDMVYNATRPRWYRGLPENRGTVVLEFEFDDIGHVLSNAIATPTSTEDGGGEAGTHSHVFGLTYAKPAATPISLTCQRITGVEDLRAAGCMIDAITVAGQAGSIVTVTLEIVFQSGFDSEVDDTIGTLSTAPFANFHESDFRYVGTIAGTPVVETAGKDVTDWAVTVRNNYRYEQAAGNGVRGPREFTWASTREAFISFNRDYFNDDWFDLMYGVSASAPDKWGAGAVAVKLTSDEDISGISTAYSCSFAMNAAVLMDRDAPHAGGPDIIKEAVNFKAVYDGSTNPFGVTLINGTDNAGDDPYEEL